MRYTTFGRTGLRVSRLSMGCNRLGDPGVDPAQWPPIVGRALDLGVRAIALPDQALNPLRSERR